NLNSFGEQNLAIRGNTKVSEPFSVFGGAVDCYSNGAFPFFQESSQNIVHLENNDDHLFNADAGAEYKIDESATLKAYSFFTRDGRGLRGDVKTDDDGRNVYLARFYDENYLVALSLRHAPAIDFDYSLVFAYQSQYETYKNPPFGINDHYLNRILS